MRITLRVSFEVVFSLISTGLSRTKISLHEDFHPSWPFDLFHCMLWTGGIQKTRKTRALLCGGWLTRDS